LSGINPTPKVKAVNKPTPPKKTQPGVLVKDTSPPTKVTVQTETAEGVLQMAQKDSTIIDVERVQTRIHKLIDKEGRFLSAVFTNGGNAYWNTHSREAGGKFLLTENGNKFELPEADRTSGPDLEIATAKVCNGRIPMGKGSALKTIEPVVGMPVVYYGFGPDGKRKNSAGYITDVDKASGTFGHKCSTDNAFCGGVFIHTGTGYVVGVHYLGRHEPAANRGLILPLILN